MAVYRQQESEHRIAALVAYAFNDAKKLPDLEQEFIMRMTVPIATDPASHDDDSRAKQIAREAARQRAVALAARAAALTQSASWTPAPIAIQ